MRMSIHSRCVIASAPSLYLFPCIHWVTNVMMYFNAVWLMDVGMVILLLLLLLLFLFLFLLLLFLFLFLLLLINYQQLSTASPASQPALGTDRERIVWKRAELLEQPLIDKFVCFYEPFATPKSKWFQLLLFCLVLSLSVLQLRLLFYRLPNLSDLKGLTFFFGLLQQLAS
jgi:hypothetical protein